MLPNSAARGIDGGRVLRRGVAVAAALFASGATTALGWGCGNDCGPGTVERNGACVADCAPGTVLGPDGRCHAAGADADGDGDGDADAVGDVLTDGDADADRGEGAGADADGDAADGVDGDAEGDGALDRCGDAATCAELARAMFELMNADRLAAGCPAFTWDDRLAAAALECATGMAAAGTMGGCGDMRTRLAAQGLTTYADASEFWVRNSSLVAAEQVVATHAEAPNYLLKCSFTLAGVGIAPSLDGRFMWICQTYLTP